jgi:hypothetical protein
VQLGVRDLDPQQGEDALAQFLRVLDLLLAELRGDRVRGDDEHERVRLLDRPPQRLGEDLAVLDPLRVQPDRLAAFLHRRRQPGDELAIPPRIGDEHVGHGGATLWACATLYKDRRVVGFPSRESSGSTR